MKYLLLLPFFHLFALHPHKAIHHKHAGHRIHRRVSQDSPDVRTEESIKAYPVGRYTDPNDPDEMHEGHTLYRKEESSDWNYQAEAPYPLPLGPVVANSNSSPSYYVKAAEEEMNDQQKAYAEALQEQNHALTNLVESLQQEAAKVPELQQQIEGLKKQLEAQPLPVATPQSTPEPVEGFSNEEPTPHEMNSSPQNTP